MNRLAEIFFQWLPLAVAIIGICGLLYAVTRQSYRSSLNDPQIQWAEDGALALASGMVPAEIVPRGVLIDAGQSPAPFIAVFDKEGIPLESSATIDNFPPKPPAGVFGYAKKYGENRVTWQPNPTVRIALVVVPVPDDSGRFVAAGRNMREVERREANVSKGIGIGLIIILIGSFIFSAFADRPRRPT